MHDIFVLLAGGASFDIISDPCLHVWPLIDFLCLSDCFIASEVPSCHMIMSLEHDGL